MKTQTDTMENCEISSTLLLLVTATFVISVYT